MMLSVLSEGETEPNRKPPSTSLPPLRLQCNRMPSESADLSRMVSSPARNTSPFPSEGEEIRTLVRVWGLINLFHCFQALKSLTALYTFFLGAAKLITRVILRLVGSKRERPVRIRNTTTTV